MAKKTIKSIADELKDARLLLASYAGLVSGYLDVTHQQVHEVNIKESKQEQELHHFRYVVDQLRKEKHEKIAAKKNCIQTKTTISQLKKDVC